MQLQRARFDMNGVYSGNEISPKSRTQHTTMLGIEFASLYLLGERDAGLYSVDMRRKPVCASP